jgi:hypothetical protein
MTLAFLFDLVQFTTELLHGCCQLHSAVHLTNGAAAPCFVAVLCSACASVCDASALQAPHRRAVGCTLMACGAAHGVAFCALQHSTGLIA